MDKIQNTELFADMDVERETESEVAQSCPTLCNPMDCSLPGSSVHGFSRQEYWSGLPFPSPGDLPDPRIEPRSPALQADALTSELPGKLSGHQAVLDSGFDVWLVSFRAVKVPLSDSHEGIPQTGRK